MPIGKILSSFEIAGWKLAVSQESLIIGVALQLNIKKPGDVDYDPQLTGLIAFDDRVPTVQPDLDEYIKTQVIPELNLLIQVRAKAIKDGTLTPVVVDENDFPTRMGQLVWEDSTGVPTVSLPQLGT